MKITKAIIPAAGHGTRFLPYTKAIPKEMVPLLNKPAIQYIVQEIADSGLSECVMIIAPHKQAIVQHFGKAPELETFLQEKHKTHLLDDLNMLISRVTINYIHQTHAKGLGHAVGLAKEAVGNEFFAVILPDDIINGDEPGIGQLIKIAQKEQASVIAVQEVPQDQISSYGVIAFDTQLSDDLFVIKSVVEKPSIEKAPSNLAIIGRYILSSDLFKVMHEVTPSANGEIQLTDGIAKLIENGHKVLAYKIQGTRFDAGNPTGWLEANNELAKLSPRRIR